MTFIQKAGLVILGCFLALNICAQEAILSGTVTDKNFKDPLFGANVYFVNSSNRAINGVMADGNGEYHIKVPNQAGLRVVFSFIGYITQVVEYKGQTRIDMQLTEQTQQLKEAQITAKRVDRSPQGLTRKQMVTATQKVTLENLETAPVANVADALQGAMANVDILTGADPGSKSTIRIRGTSSLNASAEPLIVLNGVPFPAEIEDDFNFATADSDDYGQLLNISPADIESIEVLKDAAATAVWGSRGANGVLLINTKKGSKGKITFDIRTKFEVRKETSHIPLLNGAQYVSLVQDAIWNTVNDQGYRSSLDYLSMLFNQDQINFNPDYRYFNEYNQNTDWIKEVTQTGFSTDNSFSMAGGGDKATYRFSMGYVNETGTTVGTGMDRFSTTFNMTYFFSDKLDITTDFRFNRGTVDQSWDFEKIDNPRGMAFRKMPNESPYVINEDGSRSSEYFTLYENFQGTWANKYYNPVAMVNEAQARMLNYDTNLNLNLHYNILKGLDYYGYVSMKVNTLDGSYFLPSSVTGVPATNQWYNNAKETSTDKLYIATENKLIYRGQINPANDIVGLISVNTSDQNNSQQVREISGVASSGITDTGSGTIKSMSSGKSTTRFVGLIANVNYTCFGRYLLNAGYRLEGNSSVGRNERWGGFPTLGAAWLFSEESWFTKEDSRFLSTGKLRYSWGQSGNSPSGASPYIGAFSQLGNGYMDMGAVTPSRIQLNKLKWETVTDNNLGLDLGILGDKFTLTGELYHKVTSDLLQKDYVVPSSTGYDSYYYYNSGKMTNKGWELMVAYNQRFGNWGVSVSANVSQNFNVVDELPGNKLEDSYSFGNGNYASKVVVGDPLGSFYGYHYSGVYQNVDETYARDANGSVIKDIQGNPVIMKNGNEKVYPGDAKYQDLNYDGVIDKYDIQYLGNSMPTLTGGVQLGLTYKTWGLNINIFGRHGQKAINAARMNLENMYGRDNQSVAVLRRWRNEGDQTDIPRALYDKGYNYLGSDRFVEDASFLRIKTISLRYGLPKSITNAWKMTKVEFYSTVYNAFTFTNYSGQDPEVSLSGKPYYLAKDNANTPKPLQLVFGINVTF